MSFGSVGQGMRSEGAVLLGEVDLGIGLRRSHPYSASARGAHLLGVFFGAMVRWCVPVA